MFYTSGTTGHPKGVRGTLASMPAGSDPAIWQLIGGAFSSLVEGDGRTVLCGPFYHSAQWAYSFLPMITGSATIMQHKYDSAEVLRLIDEYGATNVHLVPTQMKRLVDLPSEVKSSFDGSSLQLVLHGAAPCPPLVKQAMIEWWGPVITEYYGSTEGSVITMIDSETWLAKGGSVGQPLPGMEIIVVGEDGRAPRTERTRDALLPQRDGHGLRVPQRAREDRRRPPRAGRVHHRRRRATSTTTGTCG